MAEHLQDDRLWHIERGSVARGVAIGLFFGFLLPVFQFIFAVVFAVWLRGHVAVAAGSTLVTNPLTFPPVYWLAYRLGSFMLGKPDEAAGEEADSLETRTEAASSASVGWLASMWDTFIAAGPALVLGLVVLAVVGAMLGFALTWLLWPRHEEGGTRI